jgi:hypothetical protein
MVSTPAGLMPMQVVTRPSTRERISMGAVVITTEVCMAAKRAVPSPPSASSPQARR